MNTTTADLPAVGAKHRALRASGGDPAGAAAAQRGTYATLVANPDVRCWIELHVRNTPLRGTAAF